MKKLLLASVAFMFMAGIVIQLPSAFSKSACEGLTKAKCEKTKGCQWINPKGTTKSYCRVTPGK